MKKTNQNKHKNHNFWLIAILVIAISLSFCFGIISELTLSKANIVIAIIVILVFISISIFFDMLGLAIASCSLETFTAMASRKVKGAKQAIWLNKNAAKMSSICNDVIGDVCGILSGAAGASILAKIAIASNTQMIVIASIISAIIAGLTIFGKAILKKVALDHADKITLYFAKFINIFTKKG